MDINPCTALHESKQFSGGTPRPSWTPAYESQFESVTANSSLVKLRKSNYCKCMKSQQLNVFVVVVAVFQYFIYFF